MTHILLYWNHICVLHGQEKKYLETLKETLKKENIDLEIRYFGLGYPEHMSEYLAREDAILPDIIVSADLEVYEDCRIYSKFADSLYYVHDWLPIRDTLARQTIWRNEKLLPILSIPLIFFSKQKEHYNDIPLHTRPAFAFGGINNSAVKTVVKSVWSHYGKSDAESLLSGSFVTDMPIGAFQAVRQGITDTALVPSIYALRADERTTFLYYPAEGPVLLPSFLAVRNSISEDTARHVITKLLSQELCDFYATNGDLILHIDGTHPHSKQETDHYFSIKPSWLDSIAPEEFYELYCSKLPTARDPFQH